MKKVFVLVVLCVMACCCFSGVGICFADSEEESLEQELETATNEQLSSLDFDGLQDILDDMNASQKNVFGSTSFFDKVSRLLSGDFGDGFSSFFDAFINTFFEDVLGFVPLLCIVVIITILCSVISSLRAETAQKGVGEIVNFVCFGAVVVVISATVVGLFNEVRSSVSTMQTEMQILFPILLTFLAAVGGTVSVGIYQPAVAILTQVVVVIFMFVIIPIFVFMFVLSIINNFASNVRLNKMIDFCKSLLKWISTLSFGAFLGILGIQGIVAGSFDGVSVRAAKFALKSYVPILGGYLSDGFNVAVAGSVLIKNAVGVSGIFLLFASIFSPVLHLVTFLLLLKLTAAILEPISNTTIPNFLHQTAKMLGLLVMIVLAISFMYIITIGLILCTANVL